MGVKTDNGSLGTQVFSLVRAGLPVRGPYILVKVQMYCESADVQMRVQMYQCRCTMRVQMHCEIKCRGTRQECDCRLHWWVYKIQMYLWE